MNIKLLISLVLVCLIVAEKTDIVFQQFLKFKNQFNKQYNDIDEFIHRFNVFKTNFLQLESVEEPTHTVGITKYADLTLQEFRGIYLKPIAPHHVIQNKDFLTTLLDGDAPDAFDWRDKGAVSAVKDQGQCCSCGILYCR
jgi:cathepsin F